MYEWDRIPPIVLTRPPLARSVVYGLCQLGGWGLYVLVTVLTLRGHVPLARSVIEPSVAAAIGVGLTHLFRAWVRPRGWLRLSALQLVGRVVGASAAIAVPFVSLLALMELGIYHDKPPSLLLLVISATLRWMLMFLVWQLLYFGAELVRLGREASMRELHLAHEAKASELRALKAQLNPHFLFNTLNSIRALVGDEAEDARDAITQLARILRYSLASENTDTVALGEELAIVQDYLALERLRLTSRLTVVVDLDDRAKCVHVPTMLVQTLVENAVKHGIAQLPAGGTLFIHARFEQSTMVLVIENPAAQMTPEFIAEAASTQIGVRNAKTRLALLMGERGSLRFARETTADRCVDQVRVSLTVPEKL